MYGPLTDELKILVAHMSWGMGFNDALTEFSDRIDLPLIKKATVLIIEAGKHGGDLADIFDATANYVENINAWTQKRRSRPNLMCYILFLSVHFLIHNYHYFRHDVQSIQQNKCNQRIFHQTDIHGSPSKTIISTCSSA